MDEQENGGAPLANGADTTPVAGMISQYVKDLSFENPNSPAIYQSQAMPRIDVQFNIGTLQIADDIHEVILKIDVRSETDDGVAFVVDLSYAGLFGIRNVPQEHMQPFLLGEAPRLLFPFARRVLADTVRDGGFQPLLLEPIDFHALYSQQVENQPGAGMPAEDIGHA
ncbi:MAG: protein-export chaperone SecB [Sphingomonas sp. 28-62-20]|uniref:protein-export chaperone SecB n=1 Tax=Sphingomonas sp. 28-62-20 TaxID=1970433 RepID=UPI000A6F1FD5|nr:MAG: protein-export chaperone SecB [Sphingomonas sp. 28-62-20]